jgi:hypothetical protein
MGVIKRGILGGFSGKVANVVGSSWKGIAYMKSMPLSVANPQTTAQTTQRNAFSKSVEIAGGILADWVKPLWDRFAQNMSGYNAFVQANIPACPNGVFNPALAVMSKGTLYKGAVASYLINIATKTMTWELSDQLGNNGLATDQIYIVVWNETQNYWFTETAEYTRAVDAYQIVDPDMANANMYHVWLCYRRADGTMVSDSNYNSDLAS